MRPGLLTTTALSTVALIGTPAMATDLNPVAFAHEAAAGSLPAVSGVNGKITGFSTWLAPNDHYDEVFDDVTAYGVAGALSVPLGHAFGAQFDGLFGNAGESHFYGGAAHLFWRDPSKGLVGVYGSYLGWNTDTSGLDSIIDGIGGADVGKIGVEAEAYHGRASLEGHLTYQFGDADGLAGDAAVAYYLHDDLRFDAGYRYLQGLGGMGTLGVEWAPAGSVSVFADAAFGANDFKRVTGGLTIYLGHGGDDKSLIRRHREDDPEIDLPKDLFMLVGNCPANYNFDDEDGTCRLIK